MKLVNVTEMKAIEKAADAAGWTYADMMEQAGAGLAEIVHSFYGYQDNLSALGLVGTGNNGGDTLVALAALADAGWQVKAYLVKERSDDPLVARVKTAGGEVLAMPSDAGLARLDTWLEESTVLLDGVLGTGAQLPLKPEIARLLGHIKDATFCPPVVAVDCPSGVDCDSGACAPETLIAEVTVCMAAIKAGLLALPAHEYCGEFQIVGIGVSEDLPEWEAINRLVTDEEWVRGVLPLRQSDGHKGTFGTVTVAGGAVNYPGAVMLAAGAAGRVGAGLVQAAVPNAIYAAVAGSNLNLTWVMLPHQMGALSANAASVLLQAMERTTILLLGPGLGLEAESMEFVRRLLEGHPGKSAKGGLGFVNALESHPKADAPRVLPPLVVDADGLKALAKITDWPAKLPEGAILTPHPGEMAVLTGLDIQEIQNNRLQLAEKYAREWKAVVVLKGAFTVVAAPDGQVAVTPVATTALAHAGTGDVLAGMIAGLRAQGMPAFEASAAGAWLHGQAGLAAMEHVGHEASVQATDVLAAIPEVLRWVW